MLPLPLANAGEEVVVKRISAAPDVAMHIKTLGITEGSIVKIISQSSGDVILQVKESRLALSSSIARKIYV